LLRRGVDRDGGPLVPLRLERDTHRQRERQFRHRSQQTISSLNVDKRGRAAKALERPRRGCLLMGIGTQSNRNCCGRSRSRVLHS
jgi:hypothetical protein